LAALKKNTLQQLIISTSNLSTPRKIDQIMQKYVCIAFGQSGVKGRVKRIWNKDKVFNANVQERNRVKKVMVI
jgi:hypothetical protein